jgi:hypothetical protein
MHIRPWMLLAPARWLPEGYHSEVEQGLLDEEVSRKRRARQTSKA